MGFLNLEGLERFWSHIVAFVGEKIDSLNLKNGTGNKAIKQVGANDATGINAAAFGNGTKATGNAAMATGYATEANGDYSSASGIMTKANGAYGSVIGKYNETPDSAGYYVAKGTLWTTYENNTTYTRAIGTPTADLTNGKWIYEGTEQVLGSELQVGDVVQPSSYNYTELIGLRETTDTGRTFNWDRYRIENYSTKQSTYAFTVGNGNSNTARSNAHTLDWNGNAWFAGNVSVGENKVPLATENFVIEKDDLVVTINIDNAGTIISDKTYEEIAMAIEAGRDVFAKAMDNGLGYYLPLYIILEEAFIFGLNLGGMTLMLGINSSNTWTQETESISMEPLTFTGAVEATYNGSSSVNVEIPNSDWESNINEKGYIANRTHYVLGTQDEILFQGTLTANNKMMYGSVETLKETLFSEGIYKVTWNGTTHYYQAATNEATGEASLISTTSGVQINISADGILLTDWSLLGATTAISDTSLIIYGGEIVKAIDPKYLILNNTLTNLKDGESAGSVKHSKVNTGNTGSYSFSFGIPATGAKGKAAFAIGGGSIANGDCSQAEGDCTNAKGRASHAEGQNTVANGECSHAEGFMSYANGKYSYASGYQSFAEGESAHAEGYKSIAKGAHSHAENNAIAIGTNSHAESAFAVASGTNSHAEAKGEIISVVLTGGQIGTETIYAADSIENLFIGQLIIAQNITSLQSPKETFYEGVSYHTSGEAAYTMASIVAIEGNNITLDQTLGALTNKSVQAVLTAATGENSHVEGLNTVASSANQHVEGKLNILDKEDKYSHIVGNGKIVEEFINNRRVKRIDRSNAHTLDWSGNAWFAGEVKVGGTNQDDEAAQTLATESYVDSKIPTPEDALALMIEMGFVDPVADENGAMYTDDNGKIFTY